MHTTLFCIVNYDLVFLHVEMLTDTVLLVLSFNFHTTVKPP
jgi:hypothetical protein